MATKKFPPTLYITRENAGTQDEYLSPTTEAPDVDVSTPVAVYQLVETGTVHVTRSYTADVARRRTRKA